LLPTNPVASGGLSRGWTHMLFAGVSDVVGIGHANASQYSRPSPIRVGHGHRTLPLAGLTSSADAFNRGFASGRTERAVGRVRGAEGRSCGCLVQRDCREYALADYTIVGVWGGRSASERETCEGRRAQRRGVRGRSDRAVSGR
jgi:hypothetical protein